MEQMRNDHSLHGIKHENWQSHMETMLLYHQIRKAENIFGLTSETLANWQNKMVTIRR